MEVIGGLAKVIEACAEVFEALDALEIGLFTLGRGVGCAWYDSCVRGGDTVWTQVGVWGRVGAMEGLARIIEACAEAVGALNELETAWFALGRGVGCACYVVGLVV